MKRMQALCLMPSITYFHKKMDQFGLGHDNEILKKVSDEAKRKRKPKLEKMPTNAEDPIPVQNDVERASYVDQQEQQPSANEGKKITDSLAQIMMSDDLDMETPSTAKKLLVYHKTKLDETWAIFEKCVPESTESIDCTSKPVTNEDAAENKTLQPDNGRKFVLDNVDIHQITHDMTEQHQNPDAHFCTLMATENRVSGNHLADDKPICNLMDMENGKCCQTNMNINYSMITMFILWQESLPKSCLVWNS